MVQFWYWQDRLLGTQIYDHILETTWSSSFKFLETFLGYAAPSEAVNEAIMELYTSAVGVYDPL